MAKKKHKKTSRFEDVYEEMRWCLDRHIRVYADRYAVETNGVWKEQDLYRITVEQGVKTKSTEYIYTEKNIAEELHKMWIYIYFKNYGKEI
jgi:hypothetical protein